MIKTQTTSQMMSIPQIQEPNALLSIKGNDKERVFRGFRAKVSADINTVEIITNARTVVRADGTPLSSDEQLNILASYQTAQLNINSQRVIESTSRFFANPDFVVKDRYIPSNMDPDLKAKEWVKTSLYHALCGVGTSFQHDGINYHVINTSKSYTITGKDALDIINGRSSINLIGNAKTDVVLAKQGLSVLVDADKLKYYMNSVISELQIKIDSGTLYVLGQPVMRWIRRESINVDAGNTVLDDIEINL